MNPIRPLAAIVESSPTLLRAAENAASAGAKLMDEAVELFGVAPKAASQAKFEPIYAREGAASLCTPEKIERIKMSNVITSSEVETPQIKLFPKAPPEITLPPSIAAHKKADALLTADYANMIHWDDGARAAVSKIEHPSSTISTQATTFSTAAEQMDQLAISGAADYIKGLSGNSFTKFLANRCGMFTDERHYWARSALGSL